MSSYCSEWMVVDESDDENETPKTESVANVEELLEQLRIQETKNLSLSQENLSLKIQNDQLATINSSLIDENHTLKYSPRFSF